MAKKGKRGRKRPRQEEIPPVRHKVPKEAADLNDIPRSFFRWRVARADLNGTWGWLNVDKELLFKEVIPSLHDYESMRWAEIDGPTGSHFISRGDCIKEAQQRLDELELDDVEELFSLRITGKRRVWGIRDTVTLNLLWWDPDHEICPSKKKHT